MLGTDRLPMGRFGPVRRVPFADVIYEHWRGQPYLQRSLVRQA
jgi:hypothetical protein